MNAMLYESSRTPAVPKLPSSNTQDPLLARDPGGASTHLRIFLRPHRVRPRVRTPRIKPPVFRTTDHRSQRHPYLVLIKGIHIEEQVLGGLGETCWIESAVTGQGSVQPLWSFGVGQPQWTSFVSSFRRHLGGPTPSSALRTACGATLGASLLGPFLGSGFLSEVEGADDAEALGDRHGEVRGRAGEARGGGAAAIPPSSTAVGVD